MMHQKLYVEKEGGWLTKYSKSGDGKPNRLATEKDETIEAMADMLDQDAESCNAHSFAGAHRALAVIMYQEAGIKAATAVMRRLVNYQGLHGMVGDAGSGEPEKVEKELGVSMRSSDDWLLTPARKQRKGR